MQASEIIFFLREPLTSQRQPSNVSEKLLSEKQLVSKFTKGQPCPIPPLMLDWSGLQGGCSGQIQEFGKGKFTLYGGLGAGHPPGNFYPALRMRSEGVK